MSNYKPTQLMIDWIAALREPGRKQARGVLGRINLDGEVSNCCLGVLVEVCGHTGTLMYPDSSDRLIYSGPDGSGMVSLPSPRIIQKLFDDSSGACGGYDDDVALGNVEGHIISASRLNDSYGWTFEQIADQAEKVYVNGTGDPNDYHLDLPEIAD